MANSIGQFGSSFPRCDKHPESDCTAITCVIVVCSVQSGLQSVNDCLVCWFISVVLHLDCAS